MRTNEGILGMTKQDIHSLSYYFFLGSSLKNP